MKYNWKRQINQSLELKRLSTKNVIRYMSNRKAVITLLIVALIKTRLLYKMGYYPEANTRIKSKKAV